MFYSNLTLLYFFVHPFAVRLLHEYDKLQTNIIRQLDHTIKQTETLRNAAEREKG